MVKSTRSAKMLLLVIQLMWHYLIIFAYSCQDLQSSFAKILLMFRQKTTIIKLYLQIVVYLRDCTNISKKGKINTNKYVHEKCSKYYLFYIQDLQYITLLRIFCLILQFIKRSNSIKKNNQVGQLKYIN